MSNPKELLRNELPAFVGEFDRLIAENIYLSERCDSLEEQLASVNAELASVKALKGQLAALINDKEYGEVL